MSDGEATRYAVGVDLGTTHCAIAYVDPDLSEGEETALYQTEIPQAVAPGQVEARDLLPSFVYLPHPSEIAPEELAVPWDATPPDAVGELARSLGAATPIRLVSSAKSWLSHAGVDRRGPILPPEAPEDVARISPVEASVRYLAHLRHAWDAAQPDAPFAEQDVVITVPASFDPAARELTAEAAERAGFARMTLLEEPQAALYSWIAGTHGAWREQMKIGDVILVVDVGGGTTDFSLIAVRESGGTLELHRIAVGDHILLGGDNMDLALAHLVRIRLERELDEWQMGMLQHACRSAKEQLLSDDPPETVPLVIAARGSKLVGGATIRAELGRQDVAATLLEGYFPKVAAGDRPAARPRAALARLGLPYAQDPGITRHLAAFLGRQADALGQERAAGHTFLHPTALLFNGGVFKSRSLRERIVAVLDGWLAAEGAPPVRVLAGADLDLAVARGAAYYAFVRRGRGVRIRGGTAKSYYVGIESSVPAVPGIEPPVLALCVAPFGMEEGTDADLPPQELGLVVGEPVRFRFFGSSVRRDDRAGTVLERWRAGELDELAPIEATLPAEGRTPGEIVPVRLRAAITEVGTLRIEAVPRTGGERWKVELDVRGSVTSA